MFSSLCFSVSLNWSHERAINGDAIVEMHAGSWLLGVRGGVRVVVATRSSGRMREIEALGARTIDIGYSGSDTFYLGCMHANTTRDYDGLIAGVAVFATALTAGNISDLYAARLG